MINISKLVANSINITTGPVDDGKTRVKYTTSSGLSDWEEDIVGELTYSSIPNISDAEVVEIGSHVTSIGDWTFVACSALTSVIIPDRLTSIGSYAFIDCGGLTSVTIGNSVESIGDNAFQNCSGLTSVTIPNSVTSIGNGAFVGCTNLTSLTFLGKTMATVQDMGNYSWELLGGGCVFHCTDGNITP